MQGTMSTTSFWCPYYLFHYTRDAWIPFSRAKLFTVLKLIFEIVVTKLLGAKIIKFHEFKNKSRHYYGPKHFSIEYFITTLQEIQTCRKYIFYLGLSQSSPDSQNISRLMKLLMIGYVSNVIMVSFSSEFQDISWWLVWGRDT